MKVTRASLARLLRQQTLYLSLAAVIAAIFWAEGQPVNPASFFCIHFCSETA
jgi:hypothetical protein